MVRHYSRRLKRIGGLGFSLVEILVVVAVIGIVMVLGLPFFISYWQSATLKAGAQELVSVLNTGRQLAIKQNTSVCVKQQNGTEVQYVVGSCTGTVWIGSGTDANGWIKLQNSIQVTNNPQVIFTYLGAATPAGTYTVTNPVNAGTLSVIVAASGRISIGP